MRNMLIAREVVLGTGKNAAMSIPAVRKWRLSRPRAGERFTGADEDLERYAFQSLRILWETAGDLRDKTVLEIGPGDFLTSGLSILAAGATSYSSTDRFVGDYSQLEGKHWYTAIQSAWPRIFPDLPWPHWLAASNFPEAYPDRVHPMDLPIERAEDIGRFDVVCSFQVGEHVSDIDAFARASAVMLNPGGCAVHRIDFGPHGLFHHDPLTFLRIPEPLWWLMGSSRGLPNRRRLAEMVEAFERAGLEVTLSSVDVADIEPEDVGRLPSRLRGMTLESVATLNAVFTCRHAEPSHLATQPVAPEPVSLT